MIPATKYSVVTISHKMQVLPLLAYLQIPAGLSWFSHYSPTYKFRQDWLGSPTTRDSAIGSPTTPDSAIGSPTTRDSEIGSPTTRDSAIGSPTTRESAIGSPTTRDWKVYPYISRIKCISTFYDLPCLG